MKSLSDRIVLLPAILLLLALLPLPATAADFDFTVVLRAGLSNSSSYELGIGPAGVAPTATANLVPYWGNNTNSRWELGYDYAGNSAYVRVYTGVSTYVQASYVPTVGPPAANATWTLPALQFGTFLTARPSTTGVTASSMAFSPGVNVIQGLSTTTLRATQTFGFGYYEVFGNPIIFTSDSGGSWMLSGQIAFVGLSAYIGGNGARNGDAGLTLTAESASSVPEPSTFGAAGTGLLLLALWRRRGRGGSA